MSPTRHARGPGPKVAARSAAGHTGRREVPCELMRATDSPRAMPGRVARTAPALTSWIGPSLGGALHGCVRPQRVIGPVLWRLVISPHLLVSGVTILTSLIPAG